VYIRGRLVVPVVVVVVAAAAAAVVVVVVVVVVQGQGTEHLPAGGVPLPRKGDEVESAQQY